MKIALIVLLCCLLLVVDAFPSSPEKRCVFWFCKPKYTKSWSNKDVECDKIAKYNVDWFIENALKAKKPAPSTCLFYTRGLSKKAQEYAKKKADPPMTTIWEVWPGGYYNKKATTNNPLRCIMQKKDTEQRLYFQNMSKAFASMCDVFATVMDSGITPKSKTFDTVNKLGIWFKTEFPMLRKGYLKNIVYQIEAISEDGKTKFDYWTRKGAKATSEDDEPGSTKDGNTDVIEDMFGDADGDIDSLGKTGQGQSDQDDLYPGWWDEDGILSDQELENWELDPK